MPSLALLIAILVLGFTSGIAAAMVLILFWIARGEPDVNGDVERDAGVDSEIEDQSRAWDRGSASTAANHMEEPRHA